MTSGNFKPLPDRNAVGAGDVLPESFTQGVVDNFEALASTDALSGAAMIGVSKTAQNITPSDDDVNEWLGAIDNEIGAINAAVSAVSATAEEGAFDVKTGSGFFNPASAASTEEIAHGLGRIPKLVRIQWGSGVSANSPEVTVPHGWMSNSVGGTGDTNAISRVSTVAGQSVFSNGFTVDGINGGTYNWIGTLSFDATNITIGVSVFSSGLQINFTWEALG